MQSGDQSPFSVDAFTLSGDMLSMNRTLQSPSNEPRGDLIMPTTSSIEKKAQPFHNFSMQYKLPHTISVEEDYEVKTPKVMESQSPKLSEMLGLSPLPERVSMPMVTDR